MGLEVFLTEKHLSPADLSSSGKTLDLSGINTSDGDLYESCVEVGADTDDTDSDTYCDTVDTLHSDSVCLNTWL